MALIRLPAVKAQFGYRSSTSVYNAITAGLVTKPVHIGARAVGWPDYEIEAINAARIAGKTDDEIRVLVEHLQGQRAVRFERLTASADPLSAQTVNLVEMGGRG